MEFVANYDTKINKRRSKSKIICWVSFNQHKNPENHYKELLVLFKPFQKLEFNLENIVIHGNMLICNKKVIFKKCKKKLYVFLIYQTIMLLNGRI